MTTIKLTTEINAPREKCFDISLDVNIHKKSTSRTKEFVLEGRESGLFTEGEIVTWRAKHFGIWQNLTVRIYDIKRPDSFKDKMVKGAFKSLKHLHIFEFRNGITIMTDVFKFETPYGIFGKLFDVMILKRYMMNFLKHRNSVIKSIAESES